MKALEDMTGPELDVAFAKECLGWRVDHHGMLINHKGGGLWLYEWTPHTNPSQAVQYAIPWLNANKIFEYWYHFPDSLLYYDYPQTKTSTTKYIDVGDLPPNEQLATALLRLCLRIVRGNDEV